MTQKTVYVGTTETPRDIDINFENTHDNFTELYAKNSSQDVTIAEKQDSLVSGTNIKTINGTTLLGSGNLTIDSGGGITEVIAGTNLSGGGTSSTVTLSLATASTSTTGALSSTDWNTFNGKSSFDGDYDSLTSKPTLGTAATRDVEDTVTNGYDIPNSAAVVSYGDANWKAKTPSTLTLTASTTLTEAQLLSNEFITNYGATGTVELTFPALSYRITQTLMIEAGQIITLTPPPGESLDLSGTTLSADQSVNSPTVQMSKVVITRIHTTSGWMWSIDVVRGTWAAE